jgi:tryptophanyl-tRNA synthetase
MTDTPPPAYAGPARVLSGVQPTGALHLGNYLGALVKFTRLQHEMETFIFVADLHAITQWQDPKRLKDQVREIAAAYLASGLDPKVATIFPQSAVPAHAELAWVFNCVARLGWLDRMTQFKDKAGKHKERESVGLYTYPVLQAADILLYRATHVPVGEDQRQHLELTRDLATRFNSRFGKTFEIPEAHILKETAKIYDLQEPTAKMSKSAQDPKGLVNLMDEPTVIAKKIKSAVTDTDGEIRFDRDAKPGVSNLLSIYSALTGESIDSFATSLQGQGYGALKTAVADAVVATLDPIRLRAQELLADPAELDRLLAQGAAKANEIAERTLADVYDKLGFVRP